MRTDIVPDEAPEPSAPTACIPGRIGLANISLAIAFTLAFFLAPGARALKLLVDAPVLQSIPVYQAHILTALANYWVIGLLVYLLLRLGKAESWLKPRPAIQALFGGGNALLVVYLVPRILASTIQGGGPSYAVAMFSPFFVGPAQLLFLAGFLWLGGRSLAQRKLFNLWIHSCESSISALARQSCRKAAARPPS